MEIYIMRHGEAVHPSEWRGNDNTRPLTSIGLARLEAAVQDMKRVGFLPKAVITSPMQRAKQTGETVALGLSIPNVIVANELISGAHADAIRKTIFQHADKFPVLIVGHMPELAVFASKATFEASVLEKGFEPGEMLALEAGPLQTEWGKSTVSWWRKTGDWKKAKVS